MRSLPRSALIKQTIRRSRLRKAVRRWYERYDEILRAAVENSMEMQSFRNVNSSNAYELCSRDRITRSTEHTKIAAQRNASNDQAQIERNFNAESRSGTHS